MDKALPPSSDRSKPNKTYIRLSPSNLPGSEETFKANVAMRQLIGIEEIAARIHKNRSEYRPETLINVYRLMTNEVYRAIESGYNVDIDLGRIEIAITGRFTASYDRFDPKRHHCTAAFRPSPRLKQLAGDIRGEVTEYGRKDQPWIIHVSYLSEEQMKNMDINVPQSLPVGFDEPLWIYGRSIKVMGDLPGVGVTLGNEDTGETYFIPSNKLYINTAEELCFSPPAPLTAGTWTVSVCTQYNHRYELYKQPRIGEGSFNVAEQPALPEEGVSP